MKGGTGKTTISFNLSERAFRSGIDVCLLDFDPQEGSLGIADLRSSDPGRPCWPVMSRRVSVSDADDLSALRSSHPDRLMVCDLPGADSMALVRLLSEMDLILSPVGSGVSDLLAAANFAASVRGTRLDLPLVFVPNNITHIHRRREVLMEELGNLGLEVCPVVVHGRVAHLDSLRKGLGVCEHLPRSVAALEITRLWEWSCRRLGIESGNLSLGGFTDDSTEPSAAYSLQG